MTDGTRDQETGTFDLSPDAMRELGYRVIDMIVEHRAGIRDKPVVRRRPRADYDAVFGHDAPAGGRDPGAVLADVGDHILTGIAHTDHPRFYGYVPSPGNFVSVLGDALAGGFNVFAGHCLAASSAAAIEATTLGWLRDLMGLPQTAGGIFVSGGSMAGLTALHCARTWALGPGEGHDPRLAVYGTAEAHSSLAKALRILGFAPGQLRIVPTDDRLAMDVEALRSRIEADLAGGARPFAVIATAGTTSTGAIDPMAEIRRVCDAHGLWMHVDGAYGGAARLSPRAGGLLAGIESADSLVIDPHKWWFQPYEIGCVLVRDSRLLKRAFSVEAEYLREAAASGGAGEAAGLAGEINFYDYGPQLTRSFRALKLWMFIETFGVDAIRAAIEKGIALAETAQAHIEASAAWEIVTPAQLGVLTFRSRRAGRRTGAAIKDAVAGLLENGFALITTTEVRGETVLRLCPIHPDARMDDVAESLARLERFLR